jgi:hypothetical protein
LNRYLNSILYTIFLLNIFQLISRINKFINKRKKFTSLSLSLEYPWGKFSVTIQKILTKKPKSIYTYRLGRAMMMKIIPSPNHTDSLYIRGKKLGIFVNSIQFSEIFPKNLCLWKNSDKKTQVQYLNSL